MNKRLAIASDHAGFAQKQLLAEHLQSRGYQVDDFGPADESRVDYPDYAKVVAQAVAAQTDDVGILICGTGIGMAISANKVFGIRAANCTSPELAALAREHNNANVLTLSARFVSFAENERIVEAFLSTDFAGGRHALRVAKIKELEL